VSGPGQGWRGWRGWRRWRRPQIALVALVAAVAVGYGVNAARSHDAHPGPSSSSSPSSSGGSSSSKATVALSSLPPQVTQTVRLIKAGGPFPYSQDGVVFDNNEHLLPAHPRGYYHEYTVVTPGANDRSTRRIVTGQAGEFYYTDDHYESFRPVDISS
jgi:ribonuclease T1